MSMAERSRRTTVLVLPTAVRSAPWACRSLARAGFRVIGASDEAGRLIGRNLTCPTPEYCPSPLEDADAFVEKVDALCRREHVDALLPLDEASVRLLGSRAGQFGDAVVCGPTESQFHALCDKVALAATAERAGVATPRRAVVDSLGSTVEWPPLPSIVKPASTGTVVDGNIVYRTAALARSAAERDELVADLVQSVGGALVEEQLHGRAVRIHFVRGVRGLATVALDVLRSWPQETGMSSVQRVVSHPAGLRETAEALLAEVDYRGAGTAQFIQANGRFVVHDVNLRLPATAAISIRAGLDMARLAVEEAMGRAPTLELPRVRPVTYTWLDGQLRSLDASLHGDRRDAPRLAKELVLAALSRRRILDPSDPLALASSLGAFVKRRAASGPPLAGAGGESR
jgi:carbamoylphosphate synthase large subunit